MRVSINLAKEFETILKEYGHDVLVLRVEKKKRCSCYNEVTLEASRTCPACFGLGWSYIAERHTCRAEDASIEESLVRAVKGNIMGNVVSGGRKYFFLPNMRANEQDLIIEVEWDRFGKPKYNNGGVWEINYMDENLKLGQGKEVYRAVYVSETPVHSNIRGIRISEVNGIVQYQVALEK